MSVVVVVKGAEPARFELRRCGRLDRLIARVHSTRLDKALAAGASPDSGSQLSLRAHVLLRRSVRRDLARELRSIVSAARRPRCLIDATVPLPRAKILAARGVIEEIAEWLEDPAPADVRGIALLRLLLRDGGSALYSPSARDDLQPALQAVIDALDPHTGIEMSA